MLISKSFELYCTDVIAFKGLSAKTEEAYINTMKHLLNRFGDVDMEELSYKDIRDWKLWLDKGRSSNTVRNYIVCLRVVLRFLSRRNYNVIHYDDIPVPKKVANKVDYLTYDEINFFIECAAQPKRGYCEVNRLRNIAILELLACTGLRNSELCSLNVDSIKNCTFTIIGKGGKMGIGFVSNEAAEAMNRYLHKRGEDGNNALFVSNLNGKRINTGCVRRIFEANCKRSGMEGIHPHVFRHSFATNLLKNKVDIRSIQELMRHKSLETTAHYTHVINEDLREVHNRIYNKIA